MLRSRSAGVAALALGLPRRRRGGLARHAAVPPDEGRRRHVRRDVPALDRLERVVRSRRARPAGAEDPLARLEPPDTGPSAWAPTRTCRRSPTPNRGGALDGLARPVAARRARRGPARGAGDVGADRPGLAFFEAHRAWRAWAAGRPDRRRLRLHGRQRVSGVRGAEPARAPQRPLPRPPGGPRRDRAPRRPRLGPVRRPEAPGPGPREAALRVRREPAAR